MSEQLFEPRFTLQRIYIKDLSFESPRAPAVFQEKWQPQINLELNSRHVHLGESQYEVTLSATVTANNEADEAIFLVEVQQAGVFLMRELEGDMLARVLGASCPDVLFPYMREAIDAAVIRGNFPPLMLAPVCFDTIYEQAKLQQKTASIQ